MNEFKIAYLNGSRLKRALVAGSKRVIARHDYLNKINVYPVSDNDTGTNISITLTAGLKALALEHDETIPNILNTFADGTLEAARGNSGTIFAQFFQGLAEAGAAYDSIDPNEFIGVFAKASAHAYAAVSTPMEGTILTVLSDVATYLNTLTDIPDDFAILFQKLIEKANQSLAETPEKLKMLKKFGVVDAGAQAMVDFFEGIFQFILEGDIKKLIAELEEMAETEFEGLHEEHAAGNDSIEDYRFRFCTECVILGDNIDQVALKAAASELGDSLVVAGGKRKIKIHIHVNEPAKLFAVCRQFGKLLNEKAEDMFHQVRDAHGKRSKVAIITDSSIDLPKELLDSLNIHVIPIRIHIDDEAYIDGISITPEEFYAIVKEKGVIPKTAHPTYRDFKAKYQFLASHYDSLISIHIGKHMSNTTNAAELVKRDLAKVKLDIIDSQTTSVGLGLIVKYAAELALQDIPHDEIVAATHKIIQKTELYGVLENLDYAVKGGRVPKFAKTIADLFHVCPIAHLRRNEKAKIIGVSRGQKEALQKLAKKLLKNFSSSKKYNIAITHCQNLERAELLFHYLNDRAKNITSHYLTECGVTIGSHSGPGLVAISYQEVPISKKS
jgi:DegV family protein with EDD domain